MLSKIPVAIRLSLSYLVLGTLWIIFSGRIAERLANGDMERMQAIEQYKGILYVVISTLFLFFLSRNLYDKMTRSLEEYKVMEKKNDALITATKEGIYEYNIREDRVMFNPTMRQILGIHDTEIIYDARKFWEVHIHADDLQRVLRQFDSAMRAGVNYWREEYRALTINGDIRHVLHSVYILKDDWGVAYGVVGAIQDLTEFRQLEVSYHQQQLRQKTELSRSIIQAEEKERNRWAEELHDNIAQVLSVASLYAGTVRSGMADIDTVGVKIREMLELSVQEIRALSANLKPPRFEEQTLGDAIGQLVSYISRVRDIQVTVEVDNQVNNLLDAEEKLMVYRIIQEQMSNCMKYADASQIAIAVQVLDSKTTISVKDNGRGFDASQLQVGTGMRNIRSRLELFQGEVDFYAAPGEGCELKARFPVQQLA